MKIKLFAAAAILACFAACTKADIQLPQAKVSYRIGGDLVNIEGDMLNGSVAQENAFVNRFLPNSWRPLPQYDLIAQRGANESLWLRIPTDSLRVGAYAFTGGQWEVGYIHQGRGYTAAHTGCSFTLVVTKAQGDRVDGTFSGTVWDEDAHALIAVTEGQFTHLQIFW